MVCSAGIRPGSWWDPSLPRAGVPCPAASLLQSCWSCTGSSVPFPVQEANRLCGPGLTRACPFTRAVLGMAKGTFGREEVALEVTPGSPHAVTSPGAVTVLAPLAVGCLNPPLCSPQTTMSATAGKPSGKGRHSQVSGGQRPLAPSLVGFGPGRGWGRAGPAQGAEDAAQGPSLPRPGGAVLEAGEGAAGGAEEAAEPSGERWALDWGNWAHWDPCVPLPGHCQGGCSGLVTLRGCCPVRSWMCPRRSVELTAMKAQVVAHP